jgi:glycosyltransferase involved in cell wall biosynthesis
VRVLLVGSGIVPYRTYNQNNFWLDIIEGLRRRGHEVEVLSVMRGDFADAQAPGARISQGISIRRLSPIPVPFGQSSLYNDAYPNISETVNYASHTLSFPRIVRALRRRRRAFRPDVIHFIENYGPVMLGLRRALAQTPLTISAFTYRPTYPVYHVLLRSSYASFDSIAPLTEAFRQRLIDDRYASGRVRTIRWGIDLGRFVPPSEEARAKAREELGIRPDTFVVFWAGFIQQYREVDFRLALRTAELLSQQNGSKFVSLFCFKPWYIKDSYRALERPGLRVFGSPEEFHAARTAADVLLSPLQDLQTTAAPPLTWLECMAMGIPVVTTMIPGAEEAVVDGQSGFRVSSPEAAAERIREIADDPRLQQTLREGAHRIAAERYSVERALDEYLEFWSSAVKGRISRPSKEVASADASGNRPALLSPDAAPSKIQ